MPSEEVVQCDGNGEYTRKRKRRPRKSKDRSKNPVSSSRDDTQLDELSISDDEQLCFVDTAPAPVPAGMSSSQPSEIPLLLPSHVSVLNPRDDLPIQIIQPVDSDSDSESYIEYLDYDDRLSPGMVRYFEASTKDQKQARFVCKRCGAENEHRTHECPIQICLTCGARDEHSTRSCPISKTCFNCGMKGHINKSCPNRHSRGMMSHYDDCDRCGSDKHNTNECPTIWRLYEYVTDREREVILQHRESNQSLALGKGGEGYIARDEWCYNCGNGGHLGDDCNELPRPHDAPSAPSAFGLYNTLSGPFSDAAAAPRRVRRLGRHPPVNVGKRARNKDRMRMEQRALELQEQDDPDDWFGNSRNVRNRGTGDARPRREGADSGSGFGKRDTKIRVGRAWKSDDPPHSHHHSHHDRYDRDRDRVHNQDRTRDQEDDGRHRLGLRIRGSASRNHSSRRHDEERERESHKWEENRIRDRMHDHYKDHDEERTGWRGRNSRPGWDDRGLRGPQYRGGYV
ncbi:hypothetical protein B0F90DRAFT_1807637 [Multifurca ochricompacta]|uniref:CCHC-type domain-containing protein n=1 Tax=Multifurca ochricompacta TaxID=376703 RepID=A0AAD4QSH6_9AGAM|nr:hypothetical protein B0F90DRAFT_1807637 [Multifurca ochricompacta]